MPDAKLNWATARVDDGNLTVRLEGKLPSGWKKSFETTLRLLGSRDWGKVRLKKQEVSVADVARGTEAKLRHYLEAVVEQANDDHQGDAADSKKSDADADRREGPDAQMTERFRSFAEQERD